VVDDLKAKGAVFVEELAEVPDGATVIFSAHGVPQAVREEADARGLRVFDATCPLVTKVHLEVSRLHKQGYEIVMIGHKGHPEVEGTMGQATGGCIWWRASPTWPALAGRRGRCAAAGLCDPDHAVGGRRASIVAALRPLPGIVGPKKDDICYATQNRQDAVKSPWPARWMW
jgi:4-hydroxy-3-methylbut-2-enyl diphosphate reductase